MRSRLNVLCKPTQSSQLLTSAQLSTSLAQSSNSKKLVVSADIRRSFQRYNCTFRPASRVAHMHACTTPSFIAACGRLDVRERRFLMNHRHMVKAASTATFETVPEVLQVYSLTLTCTPVQVTCDSAALVSRACAVRPDH